MLSKIILLATLILSLIMTGIIWFVQIIHYPLFKKVGADGFVAYVARHTVLAGYLIAPIMLMELILSIWLALASGPHQAIYIFCLILLGIIWLTTIMIQVPTHNRLKRSFEVEVIHQLVNTNWIRTVGWTIRSIMLAYVMFRI